MGITTCVMKLVLFHNPMSSTSMRAFMTLKLKDLGNEIEIVKVEQGWNSNEEYLAVNPEGRVPALQVDGRLLTQSWAIMLFLEELFPDRRSLMPQKSATGSPAEDMWTRAQMHRLINIIACDTHPLQNLAMLSNAVDHGWMVGQPRYGDAEQKKEGLAHHPYRLHYLRRAYSSLEAILRENFKHTAGRYCIGDELTFADVFFACQTRNLVGAGVDLSVEFPQVRDRWSPPGA